ncbi:MAG: hypothetical protein JXQ80_08070 [Bacteroidales bacterium]|nr:hypothetical protein [Bacteroidales bacterium]
MRFRLLAILLTGLLLQAIHAQNTEYANHISRSFRVGHGLSVEIANKYGRIQVIPWDNDSVRFDIDIKLRAKDRQKLEKMKQNIDFEFTKGQYYLIARTSFGEAGSDVFKDLVDIASAYLSSSNSVSINYTLRVPDYLTLKIENKFGDVLFDDHQGNINLTLSFGNLKANRLTGRSELKLTQGDGEIGYLREGRIEMSYGDLHLTEAGKLDTKTQSCVITIDKLGSLSMNSRRDKLFLHNAGTISGESYFSRILIGSLHNNIETRSRYGDISINDIRRTFSNIVITSELTHVVLLFERPMLFDLDLTHNQAVTFVYPKNLSRLTTKVINAEDKMFSTKGVVGSGTPQSSVVISATRKCNVTLSQK